MLSRLTTPLMTPLRDHWRGEHSLLATVALSIIGLRILTSYLPPLLPKSPYYLIITIWIAANIAIVIWQVVSTHRSTQKLTLPPSDTMGVWVGQAAILGALVIAIIQTIDGIAAVNPSLPKHHLATAKPLPVSEDGTVVTLQGGLNYNVSTALDQALATHTNLKRLVLNSDGGHIYAARTIARQIAIHNLDTHIDAHCYSACTIVFLAGNARTMSPEGQLGFHQYQMQTPLQVQTVHIDVEQEKDRKYFASRGVSSDFLDQVFKARHSSIWRPDHTTLYKAGVLTSR